MVHLLTNQLAIVLICLLRKARKKPAHFIHCQNLLGHPLPCFLGHNQGTFLPKKMQLFSSSNVQIFAEKFLESVWIGVNTIPPPLLKNVQIQAEKVP